MSQVKAIRTFAINAKDLAKAEEFYTRILGAEVVRRIDPNDEQLQRGRVMETHVRLGNFQIHLFDASKGSRQSVPHHTITIPWKPKEEAIQAVKELGARIENTRDHPDGKGYSVYCKDSDGNLS